MLVIVTVLQSSEAVAVPMLTDTQHWPPPFALTAAGQVIVGAVVSVTVIVCTQIEVLPQSSVAVQVRVITWLPAQALGASESLYV